jgi:hypothetical protein
MTTFTEHTKNYEEILEKLAECKGLSVSSLMTIVVPSNYCF